MNFKFLKTNKRLSIISFIFLFSITIVIALYLLSGALNPPKNNFVRIRQQKAITPLKALDVKYNSYHIAGATKYNIYLGNITATSHILVANTMLTDTQHITIKNLQKHKFGSFQLRVDSPSFYIVDYAKRTILQGSLKDLEARKNIYDSIFFSDAVPISNTSFVTRTFNQNKMEYVLAKETTYPPYINRVPNLLEKQIDGLFCTDGTLQYNSDLNMIVYVYFYRNQFICMDSSLRLLYRGNTIDQTYKAKIKVAEIKSENSRTLAEPPLLVNLSSCASGNWLFVQSNLIADNENKNVFNKSSVIDVYNLKTGKYKFSFNLFDYNGNKLKYFRVFDNTLVTINGNYLLTYRLNREYFIDSL